MVVEDAKGERLVMTDTGMAEEPHSCHLLSLLPQEVFADQTLIVRFRHDLDSRKLQVKPLSIVTGFGHHPADVLNVFDACIDVGRGRQP